MFDFIPLEYYTSIYYHVMFFVAMIILLHAMVYDIKDSKSLLFFQVLGAFFLVIFSLYIGLRPVSGRYFGDMSTYHIGYEALQKGGDVKIEKDYVFNYFMWACSKIMSSQSFFLLVDILYILPCYWFSRLYFKRYWFFGFFMFLGSFSFWAYGTNGIRNGLATSLFILGLCFYEHKKMLMYVLFGISFFMHSSIIIPIAAFIISGTYKNPKIYLYIWLASIPLSLVGGSFWEGFFSNLGLEDRTSGYLTNNDEFKEQFSQTGFRWDFVLYSGFGIFAGYYFILKKNVIDSLYIHLFGIYTIANAFWILVIRATFSNRFAYLSWFLMAAVIAYPMFCYKLWKDQYKVFGVILFLYYMFTYLMFLKG
ncbi:EpsG family protein [Epilithonimonas hungarica]|uniref:EpsG family protein n=1 Tax=Epilithonimonas hungarica TaxID=454006 RepID=A0A1G7GHN6_9FLAO|nr:EpsG family protein [Epilithonimonas hungarica]SDE87640.1 EpsG family protein [Epilithonimonas hungarica]